MAWSGKPKHILDMIVASGQEAAQDYLNRPELPEHLAFYMDAFWDLACVDGIPFSEIDCYARRYNVEGTDEFNRLKTLVRQMNAKWVEIINTPDTKVIDEDAPKKPARPPRALG